MSLASFSYLGSTFTTPHGHDGMVAVDGNVVILVGGLWLEFTPDDAIALGQGIFDAAAYAKEDGAAR